MSASEGIDTLIDIEKVEFSDGYKLLGEDGSISDLMYANQSISKGTFTSFKDHVLAIFSDDSISYAAQITNNSIIPDSL